MKILILDNYDSFTYNLYHYVNQFCSNVSVIKNDEIELSSLKNYDKIILSPGPGLPNDHKNLMEVISVCNLFIFFSWCMSWTSNSLQVFLVLDSQL